MSRDSAAQWCGVLIVGAAWGALLRYGFDVAAPVWAIVAASGLVLATRNVLR